MRRIKCGCFSFFLPQRTIRSAVELCECFRVVVTHSIRSPSTGSTSQHGFLLVPQFSPNNIVLNVMCSQFASVTALYGLDLWDFLELLRMFLPPFPSPNNPWGRGKGQTSKFRLKASSLYWDGTEYNVRKWNSEFAFVCFFTSCHDS